ncbi:hypothetical protein LAJ55_15945, partial [Streptococcus pneumoniae]|uniref:hypothetical protein n=1 Tax=Streptococcus pneumoniae TaxID=1313 RepID=UPI001CC17CC2
MLAMDALESGCAPSLWCVVTTRTVTLDTGWASEFGRAIEQVTRAVRRRWPKAEYVGVVEFTTGYADGRGDR